MNIFLLMIVIFFTGFYVGYLFEKRNTKSKYKENKKDNLNQNQSVQIVKQNYDIYHTIKENNEQDDKERIEREKKKYIGYIITFDSLKDFREFQQYYEHYSRGKFSLNPEYVKILDNGTYVSWVRQEKQKMINWLKVKKQLECMEK